MPKQVEVRVGKNPYRITVEDGQETRLQEVAILLDSYVSKLQAVAGERIGRDQLLVLASLQMADDYYELKREHSSNQQTLEAFHNTLAERLEKLIK